METVIDPVEQFTLSVSSGQGGSVNNVDGTYNSGTQVTITATPEDGYEFTGWSDSSYGDTNPLTLTVGANTSITAQFSRIKYLLGVDVIGEGSVSQEVISAGKTPTEYNSGAVVRLESIPSDGWLFHTWSGASTDTGNIIDITIDGTKTVTASFEEIIAIVLDPNGISARGVGKWKIKKRTSLSEASKDVSSQEKILNDPCEIYEVIFRSDGTFTMISAVGTNSGNYVYTDESTIYLTKQGQEYARYENVVLTESVMSFTLILGDCDYSYKTEKDETYDEATDPLTGTITDTIECSITGGLSSGSISQTVTASYELTPIAFEFSTSCTESFIITASGLPPGISIVNNNSCCADIQGTVSQGASGTYSYSVTASNSITSLTVTGSIEVVQESIASCTSATLYLIDGQLNQTITLGDEITQTRLQLDTDCPDDDNNVPLNSISSGLPGGVGYSFDGENNQVIISGTPEFAGVFEYSITYFNNDTIDSSTVTTSIGGTFTVSSTQATTTSEEDCTINASLVSGSYNQTLSQGQTIDPIVIRINTDCTTISLTDIYGPLGSNTPGFTGQSDGAAFYPTGIDIYYDTISDTNNLLIQNGQITLTISGTLSNSPNANGAVPGDYPFFINVNNGYILPPTPQDASPIQAATTSITIQGVFTIVASSNTSSSTNNSGSIYFENGTCKCPDATVGETATISGTTYTVVDNSTIQGEVNNSNVNLCTTLVNDMSQLFAQKESFNDNISFWDTSNVTSMFGMFSGAYAFNQAIGLWDTSNVTNMESLFFEARAFNQNIADWNTSNVTTMRAMFTAARSFNQDIGNWEVSNVTDMLNMFLGANVFNRDIGSWNVSRVTVMSSMFKEASAFNQDISSWDVSNATDMGGMFNNANSFNQDISGWNVTSVINMNKMFRAAHSFNSDISNWDTSNVTNMSEMFRNADAFNRSINLWDVSSATNMSGMFRGTSVFNQSLSTWDVSSVTNMDDMFNTASAFNQDISSWCVPTISSEPNGFSTDSALSNENKPVWGTCPSDDTTPPVITLNGSSTIQLTVGDSWTDPGATATDETDGDLTSSITVSGTVVTSTVGTYTLIYSVADAASNTASTTRVVIVNPAATSSIYFENGTCKCPNATVGDSATIDGVVYTVVDNSTFQNQVDNGNVNLCTTFVTNMSQAFTNKSNFNSNISFWDTSNVTNMSSMFSVASVFNQDISNWDTSSVTDMNYMFHATQSFNQNISSWDTSNVINMSAMFFASVFNQDISGWNVSNVIDMSLMFKSADNFHQPIGNWDVSNVQNMDKMFENNLSFNQPIGNWDVSSVINMSSMFSNSTSYPSIFNQFIGAWNVSNVTNMDQMFKGNEVFNQDISNWNVSNVSTMFEMFRDASSFDQDLRLWCVSTIQASGQENFAFGTNLYYNGKSPIWGTCPGDNRWEGSRITFTKENSADPTDESNQDRITDNVWITRANSGGQIYNIVSETSATSGSSPAGTEWAQGSFDNFDSLNFTSFRDACPNQKPKDVVGVPMVLHLIADDIYIEVEFTSWSQGKQGGFSYQRTTQD